LRLLLDTHAFLWWIGDDPRLPVAARKLISGPRNEIYLSAASAWELAIKAGIGRLRLAENLEDFVTEQLALNGIRVLPVHLRHALHVSTLPGIHGDPFDRILVAQAQIEDLVLVSGDKQIARYAVTVAW
jgi:PIN domain nuclease of toxin-antitoxin system